MLKQRVKLITTVMLTMSMFMTNMPNQLLYGTEGEEVFSGQSLLVEDLGQTTTDQTIVISQTTTGQAIDLTSMEWEVFGGNWNMGGGDYSVDKGDGSKIVARDLAVSDFVYEADVAMTAGTDGGRNAGLIFRVTNPGVGADAFTGYYVGLCKDARGIQIGRLNGGWTEIGLRSIPYPINEGTKYRLKVIANGSNIDVYVDNDYIGRVVDSTYASGSVGMRIWKADTEYTNVSLVPIDPNDLQAVESVTLSEETLSLKMEESEKLMTDISPKAAVNQKLTWSSDKPDIAVVDQSGIVTGMAAGQATITVTADDGNKTDTCLVTVNESTQFKNPIVPVSGEAGSADPSVVFKDGYYYYCKSDKDASLVVAKAKRLQDIGSVPRVTVYTPPAGQMYSKGIWAPELQYIDVDGDGEGKWYIYFAADNGDNANHRMYVLESDTQDPQGSYTFKGKIADPNPASDKWAIDGTVLQKDDKSLYFIWSGWEGNTDGKQNLYIAPMSNPWTISGNRVQISTPTEAWELKGNGALINEGPEILKKNGKIFIVYSASGSWSDDYCLGMLTNTSGYVMDPASWTKTGPVFSKTTGAYGPGHNCFTVSPDGTEDWIVYHADKNSGGSWGNRSVRVQKFTWNSDDTPNFGTPAAYGELIDQPSGTQKISRYKYEAENAVLGGAAKVSAREASGDKVVGTLNTPGTDSILFNTSVEEAGKYILTVMYGSGDGDAEHNVSVNGGDNQVINYKAYGWNRWNPSSIEVTLNQGVNTIKLDPKTKFAEIDYIVLERTKAEGSVDVETVTLDKQALTLAKGKTAQLVALVRPLEGTDKDVTITSSDESVATVSEVSSNTAMGTTTLLVTSQRSGTTMIRVASADNSAKYAECEVTVLGDPTEPDLSEFTVDEFNSDTLDNNIWSIFQEKAANWSLIKNSGTMTITTTATDIYQDNNSQENVFLKAIDGDKSFEIVTKLTAPIGKNHEQAGLFVWKDADNLIKLAHVWDGGKVLETASEIGRKYSKAGNLVAHPGDDTITMKIEKVGNIYTTYYWNGYNWIQASSPVTASLKDIKVGFFANCIVSGNPIDAKFEYFAYREIPGGIKLDKTNVSLQVGEINQIHNEGPTQDVIWTSSSNKVVTVDNTGLVQGVGAGRAVIKVASADGAYSAQVSVIVTSPDAQPEVLYEETFESNAEDFITYGGTWNVSDGQYHVNSGAGYKALIADEVFTDYVLEGDIKIKSGNEAGLIFRVINPSEGVDAFSGYYIGISASSKSATLGQMNNSVWKEIATKKLPINVGATYHVKVIVNEGHIVAYINDNPLNESAYPKFDVLENTHLSTGQIGLRTFNAAASFDNLKVSSYKETVLEESYTNSVMPNIADPHVFYYEGTYYLYGTHTPDWPNMTRGIKVYTSTDLVHWTMKQADDGWALKNEDSWGDKQFWAPEVIEKNGTFYMYYAVQEHLAVATSDSPLGPFKQEVQKPIHNDPKEIDAHIFTDDDGKQYMYFVRFTDGNAIWGAELNEDMMSIKEETITPVFSVSQDWEKSQKAPTARVNEGPFVIKNKGLYYMTYSGNHFESPDYGVGYATSESPLGPWTKYEYNPIMKSNSLVPGAGHHSLIYSPDKTELFMVYHAHNAVGTTEPRKLAIDRVQFVPQANGIDSMEVWGPTMTPQPIPSSENTTPNVPVSSLTVTGQDGASTITTKGGTLQMVATVTPENATNKKVIWSIESGSEYATLNAEGLLTAKANGTVTVKATSVSNPSVSNTCNIVITGNETETPNVPVTALTVEGKDGVISITTKGGTLQMVATVVPDNATNKAVTWSIVSGDDYASLSDEGVLTASANGTVTVKAVSVSNTEVSNTCEILITGNEEEPTDIPVTGLTVTGKDGVSTITTKGGILQMVATVTPDSATNKAVTWSIVKNGSSFADLSTEGVLTAKGNGTVTVKATSVSNKGVSDTCEIIITGNSTSGEGESGGGGGSTPKPTPAPIATPEGSTDATGSLASPAMNIRISITSGTASQNGTNIALSVQPYIEKGRTMAGLRDVANLLGIENQNVVWNGNDKTITITMNNRTVQLAVNQNYVIVNGEKIPLDVAPAVRNGRTVLPVAQIARILGIGIQFDINTKEVIFNKM